MRITLDQLFSKTDFADSLLTPNTDQPVHAGDLKSLKAFLDHVHIRECLMRPFLDQPEYPLVESRELLPSFESDPFEYKELPGFSLVALDRPISYFQEVFQFDILHNLMDQTDEAMGKACPLEQTVFYQNLNTLTAKLPKHLQEQFKGDFGNNDVSALENYQRLMPYILEMDRAHVMSKDSFGNFYLSGVYASFPSDLDTEIKRFGLRIGKFKVGDNFRYERNRLFVYQYLMELYGFPIVSERRTSSALFARRLHKMGENFLIRVIGQSDRTLTTLYANAAAKPYPRVEKIALVKVDKDQKDAISLLKDRGYFVDDKKLVVILRVTYKQHKYNPDNVQQDRALSVERQEIIHPLTGQRMTSLNLIKDTSNMFLRLNDIVRGEYIGRVVYKRNEVVENTDTDDKRLKFLYSWLSKHQRRIIGYSEEFYSKVVMVLDNYLLNPDSYETFQSVYELYQEVWSKYSYIQQARKVKDLENIVDNHDKGRRSPWGEKLTEATQLLHDLKFEIVNYFDELVANAIVLGDKLLNDRYLNANYISKKDDEITDYGQEVKFYYGRLVALIDEFKAIRKSRLQQAPMRDRTL